MEMQKRSRSKGGFNCHGKVSIDLAPQEGRIYVYKYIYIIYICIFIYTSPRNYGVVSCIRGDSRMQGDLDKGISHSTLYHIWGKEKWWICTQFIVILMGKRKDDWWSIGFFGFQTVGLVKTKPTVGMGQNTARCGHPNNWACIGVNPTPCGNTKRELI